MSMKKLHFVPLLGLLLAAGPLAAQSAYQVVVSSSNPSSSMAKADVAKLFLKKTTSWSHGLKVQPVDQAVARAVRGSFAQVVHGRKVSSVKSYWQTMIFLGPRHTAAGARFRSAGVGLRARQAGGDRLRVGRHYAWQRCEDPADRRMNRSAHGGAGKGARDESEVQHA